MTLKWCKMVCLWLQLKFRSASGASRHPGLMGNCQTISHTPYSPTYPVDGGNEVWIQSIAWGQWKNLGFGRLKLGIKKYVTLLQGSEMSVGWHFKVSCCACVLVGWLQLLPHRGLVVSVTKPNHRSPSLTLRRAEHTPANFSNIVNPLLATNDGRGGMLN